MQSAMQALLDDTPGKTRSKVLGIYGIVSVDTYLNNWPELTVFSAGQLKDANIDN
jgi:hypothetical protein